MEAVFYVIFVVVLYANKHVSYSGTGHLYAETRQLAARPVPSASLPPTGPMTLSESPNDVFRAL